MTTKEKLQRWCASGVFVVEDANCLGYTVVCLVADVELLEEDRDYWKNEAKSARAMNQRLNSELAKYERRYTEAK